MGLFFDNLKSYTSSVFCLFGFVVFFLVSLLLLLHWQRASMFLCIDCEVLLLVNQGFYVAPPSG